MLIETYDGQPYLYYTNENINYPITSTWYFGGRNMGTHTRPQGADSSTTYYLKGNTEALANVSLQFNLSWSGGNYSGPLTDPAVDNRVMSGGSYAGDDGVNKSCP